ncbi:hypothetical protein ILYODFUR_019949 [Ilyodon furcidens]|uniref:Ig-like domain-containing protein n=1 Tax=Ilyodon furcidens TaxID=33524 RepID=A0ABV0UUP5_9TELE
MFTRWLTFIAFLAGSINPGSRASGWGSVTFASTCRVKVEPEEELILHCGDGRNGGVVQFWHTPFGDLQTSGSLSNLDPVFMHQDGNIVIPNSSIHHSGLYYCILQHTEGSILWPFELYVGLSNQNMEDDYEGGNGCPARRFRRNAGSPSERKSVVSEEIFAGAVAATILLTFVVGFSAGALSRTHVLRCLQAVRMRLCPKRRRHETDEPDGSQVTVTTLPPMYETHAFKKRVMHHDSPVYRTTETPPVPLTTPSPPAKPKRSFRHKEQPEGAAYLEGCGYNRAKGMKGGCDGEAKETTKLSFFLEENEGSQSETEEDKFSEDREEEDGEASRERVDWRMEKQDVAGEHSRREEMRNEEDERQTDECEELEQASTETDEERSIKNDTETMKGETTREDVSSSSPRRHRRVIRLYQYDEDGQRYSHLPDPPHKASEPVPRLKQRSLSLTRLNAIMAAASTGPMESKEKGEEKPHFRMDI